MTKTRIEQVWGELDGEGKHYDVKLNVTVKELFGSESPMPQDRAVARVELSPMSGVAVEDGKYTLRYTFDGKQEERKIRVQQGMLLSGDAA